MLGTFDGSAYAYGVILSESTRGFETLKEAQAFQAEFETKTYLVKMVEGPAGGGLPKGWK